MLEFNAEGLFKIVQFTDLHWNNGEEPDVATRRLMERVLAEERPDLAVVTGDLIESHACLDIRQSLHQAMAVLAESGIPWAAVFGNHDSEAGNTRQELMETLEGMPHCLAQSGPASITGVGNYVLPVYARDGRLDRQLFFLDSGDYAEPEVGGYAAIAKDQIDWFRNEVRRFSPDNGEPGVPALAFFHIPLPEYNEVWDRHVCIGHKFEEVCCARTNSGMFAAMAELRNVTGVFVGHDHANDYCGEMEGILLCYGRKTGYHNYSKQGFPNGARVIEIEEGSPNIRTWLRLDDGRIEGNEIVHRPEGRSEQYIQK